MGQHPGKDLRHHVPLILADSGEVDVHSVARLVCQRLGTEIGIQPATVSTAARKVTALSAAVTGSA